MKRPLLISVLVALFAAQMFCVMPPISTPVPGQSIGQIEKLQGGVQAGPESSMATVNPKRDIFDNDAVHVFDNGKANLDFGSGITFTLYNDTTSEGTNVISDGTSHQAALKLSEGGLKGHNPTGSRTTVQLPNGVNILILGTNYFITYDPVEDKVWIYNFDGTVQYQLPGGEYQLLFSRSLIEIKNGQVIQRYDGLALSMNDFDARATTLNSPIQAVKAMLATSIPVTGTGDGIDTPTATQTSTATLTATPTNTATLTPTDTPTETPTPTPIPCYLAKFVTDVTVPDGTIINSYTSFTKTWRLKNMGSCTWDSSYQIVFMDGKPMSDGKTFQWTGGVVGYGGTVDVSVNLVAPETPGVYQGNFMLLAPDGTYFGLGVENRAFWVRIAVELSNQPPAIPGIISPQQASTLYCGDSTALDWTVAYDDSGVAEYEVMLESWPYYCYTWCSVFNTSSVFVTGDALDVIQYLACNTNYRWRVRAKDNDGAWGDWSAWTEFSVYPPTPG